MRSPPRKPPGELFPDLLSETEGSVCFASDLEFLRSMIIWKNGEILGEEYFQDYPQDSLDHVRSVTKSIMSLLIGIAVDQQLIDNVDDPVSKYIGHLTEGYSPEKQGITIRQLLTMTSGFEWNEDGVEEFNQWASSSDHLAHLFNRDLVDTPGTTFNYNSGGSHLLSIILSEVSQISTLEYARKYLFDPLGIGKVRWRTIIRRLSQRRRESRNETKGSTKNWYHDGPPWRI